MEVDYLVIGAGLTGATIARHLHDAGREVLVLERRLQIGGNISDYLHPSGIRIHQYGPHYFRTSSDWVWAFVNRFAPFYRFDAVVVSDCLGEIVPWPVSKSYIAATLGYEWKPELVRRPANFEEACLAKMPRAMYEAFVKGYTAKQWGVLPRCLSAQLAKRVEIRSSQDVRLKLHKYQGIPRGGYSSFMESLLSGVPVLFNIDYCQHRADFSARKAIIVTSSIDEYFDYKFGRLTYRAQHRDHVYLAEAEIVMPAPQVNYPLISSGPQIRSLEWKQMMEPEQAAKIQGTVITTETPYSPADSDCSEYPFPDGKNAALFKRYAAMAGTLPRVVFCGRLGRYRYLDMDQAIVCATRIAEQLLRDPIRADRLSGPTITENRENPASASQSPFIALR